MDCSRRPSEVTAILSTLRRFGQPVPLSSIDLSYNNLVEFPKFPNLQVLTKMVLSYNNILDVLPEALSADRLPALLYLDMNHNGQTVVRNGSFRAAKNLKHLHLGHNHIRVIESGAFVGLDRLERLTLEGNFLESLHDETFEMTPRLQVLDISHNRLKNVKSSWFTESLTSLDISANQIRSLPSSTFSGAIRLVVLSLSSNLLSDLPTHAFQGLENLDTLQMSDNKLHTYNADTFGMAPKLKKLNLSNNLITDFVFAENATSSLPMLYQLELGSNPFYGLPDELFRSMPALVTLTLQGAKHLSHLPDMSPVRHLEVLNVRSSGLRQILGCDLENLPRLRFVSWSLSPVHCDCALRWFLAWYQPRNQLRGRNWHRVIRASPFCGSPSRLSGRSILTIQTSDLCNGVTETTYCRHPEILLTSKNAVIKPSTSTSVSNTLVSTIPGIQQSREADDKRKRGPFEVCLHQRTCHLESIAVSWTLVNVTSAMDIDQLQGFVITCRRPGSSVVMRKSLSKHDRFLELKDVKILQEYEICIVAQVGNRDVAQSCIYTSTSLTELVVASVVPSLAVLLVIAAIIFYRRKLRSRYATARSQGEPVRVAYIPSPSTIQFHGYPGGDMVPPATVLPPQQTPPPPYRTDSTASAGTGACVTQGQHGDNQAVSQYKQENVRNSELSLGDK